MLGMIRPPSDLFLRIESTTEDKPGELDLDRTLTKWKPSQEHEVSRRSSYMTASTGILIGGNPAKSIK
jgi:hypothetical protein